RFTSDTGEFHIPVLPGPGFLGIEAPNEPAYQPANVDVVAFFKKENVPYAVDPPKGLGNSLLIATEPGGMTAMPQSNFNAIELLNAPAQDEARIARDIELAQARKVTGVVLDSDGKPVAGAVVFGLRDELYRDSQSLSTGEFTVIRLGD